LKQKYGTFASWYQARCGGTNKRACQSPNVFTWPELRYSGTARAAACEISANSMSGNIGRSRFHNQEIIGTDPPLLAKRIFMSANRRVAADAKSLTAKAKAIKKTQQRLLKQLDESIQSSKLCLKQAKSQDN
jgi:hypothetical protein